MWAVVIPLIAGYVFSVKKPDWASRLPIGLLTDLGLISLLTVLGACLGADPEVFSQITRIGLEAFVLACATIAGSILVLYLLQFGLRRHLKITRTDEQHTQQASTNVYRLIIMLLGSVAVGIIVGRMFIPETALPLVTALTAWALSLLLLAIGLDLGLTTGVFSSLRKLGFKIFLIPIGIIVGSIGGIVLTVSVWNVVPWNEAAAMASGFGWGSVPSVLLTRLHSPVLGGMALILNVFRELLAIVIIPLVAKIFGPIPSLGPGGATNMDVQIPIIARGVGREYVPLAFFSGVVLALSEAALIIFFISI